MNEHRRQEIQNEGNQGRWKHSREIQMKLVCSRYRSNCRCVGSEENLPVAGVWISIGFQRVLNRDSTEGLEDNIIEVFSSDLQVFGTVFTLRAKLLGAEQKEPFPQQDNDHLLVQLMENDVEFQQSTRRFPRLTKEHLRLLNDLFQGLNERHSSPVVREGVRGEDVLQDLSKKILFHIRSETNSIGDRQSSPRVTSRRDEERVDQWEFDRGFERPNGGSIPSTNSREEIQNISLDTRLTIDPWCWYSRWHRPWHRAHRPDWRRDTIEGCRFLPTGS